MLQLPLAGKTKYNNNIKYSSNNNNNNDSIHVTAAYDWAGKKVTSNIKVCAQNA